MVHSTSSDSQEMETETWKEGILRWRRTRRTGVNIWMCFAESDPRTQVLQFQLRPKPTCGSKVLVDRCVWNFKSTSSVVSPKKPLCQTIWLSFGCVHSRTYVWMTYETSLGHPSRHHFPSGMCTHVMNLCAQGRSYWLLGRLLGVFFLTPVEGRRDRWSCQTLS